MSSSAPTLAARAVQARPSPLSTNVGPIVTPWASLATLLCLEACRRHGLRVSMRWFVLTGLGLAITALLASVGALLVTGG